MLRSTITKVSTDLTNYKKEIVAIWLATTVLGLCVFLSVVS